MNRDDIKDYQHSLISKGVSETALPFHENLPHSRRVFSNAKMFAGCNIHVAVHFINNAHNHLIEYSTPHSHEVDEINLIFGNCNDGDLEFRIQLGEKFLQVESPSSIYIPKDTIHSAKAIKGSGLFICIVMKGELP